MTRVAHNKLTFDFVANEFKKEEWNDVCKR